MLAHHKNLCDDMLLIFVAQQAVKRSGWQCLMLFMNVQSILLMVVSLLRHDCVYL